MHVCMYEHVAINIVYSVFIFSCIHVSVDGCAHLCVYIGMLVNIYCGFTQVCAYEYMSAVLQVCLFMCGCVYMFCAMCVYPCTSLYVWHAPVEKVVAGCLKFSTPSPFSL